MVSLRLCPQRGQASSIDWSLSMFFMSSPLLKLMCVRTISVGKRAARLFTTHRRPGPNRLSGGCLPSYFDAHGDVRSGLPAWAVGGVFL